MNRYSALFEKYQERDIEDVYKRVIKTRELRGPALKDFQKTWERLLIDLDEGYITIEEAFAYNIPEILANYGLEYLMGD
jgi:hypothetical protein